MFPAVFAAAAVGLRRGLRALRALHALSGICFPREKGRSAGLGAVFGAWWCVGISLSEIVACGPFWYTRALGRVLRSRYVSDC